MCLEFVKVQTKLLTLNMITYDTKSKLRDHAQEKKKSLLHATSLGT